MIATGAEENVAVVTGEVPSHVALGCIADINKNPTQENFQQKVGGERRRAARDQPRALKRHRAADATDGAGEVGMRRKVAAGYHEQLAAEVRPVEWRDARDIGRRVIGIIREARARARKVDAAVVRGGDEDVGRADA